MRCSSCKPLLAGYVEGTLSAQEVLRVSHHLSGCAACGALLDELRSVDGLLATIAPPVPAANFTFAVMAEVRGMPLPASHSTNVGALFGGYIVVAWAIIAIWLQAAGITVQSAFERSAMAFAAFLGAGHTIANSALGSFGSGASLASTFAFGVLGLDLLIALGVVLVYTMIRPRLAAVLASSPEGP